MPRGVTDQFLKILANERRHAVRAALWMLPLAAVAYFMAEMTDRPLLGAVVLLALVATALGLATGLLYARFSTSRYNDSLRAQWNQWMRMSLQCARVHEVARSVASRPRVPQLAGVGWAALFLANALLFAALWKDADWSVALGAAVTTANGLVLGTILGYSIWTFGWAIRFDKALHELLAEGKVGLWGEI